MAFNAQANLILDACLPTEMMTLRPPDFIMEAVMAFVESGKRISSRPSERIGWNERRASTVYVSVRSAHISASVFSA